MQRNENKAIQFDGIYKHFSLTTKKKNRKTSSIFGWTVRRKETEKWFRVVRMSAANRGGVATMLGGASSAQKKASQITSTTTREEKNKTRNVSRAMRAWRNNNNLHCAPVTMSRAIYMNEKLLQK